MIGRKVEVNRQSFTVVGVGLIGAVAVSHLLTNLLYGVSPFDPLTGLGVAGVLWLVSLRAGFLPAWRAARVDPIADC